MNVSVRWIVSIRLLAVLTAALLAGACGGGGSSNRAAAPAPPPPPAITDVTVELTGLQVIGGSAEPGSASAQLSINFDDRTVSGTVDLNGLTATGVSLQDGFAGQPGELIVELTENSATQWALPAGTALTQAQIDKLNAGGLHVKVRTAASPDGAARGQILLGNLQIFLTTLSGAQEVPAIESSAGASAGVTFDPDSGAVVVHLLTSDLDDAVASHIHQAFAGRNGGVVVGLEQDPNDASHWLSPAGASLDAAQADDLLAGALYLNVHTPAHPPGEVRGQILPDGFRLIVAKMTGAQEAPGVASSASAAGALTLDTDSSAIELHITATGLDDAVAAHIHRGYAGQNGGVAIELQQDPTDVEHWSAPAGTILEADQLASLDRGELYLNLHTPANPGGEVRGQLVPQGIEVISVALSGEQEIPAVVSAAAATGGLTLDTRSSAVELHITTAGLDDAAAAHIHEAFAGANGGVLLGLEQDPNDVAHWLAPAATVFDAAQLASLHDGALYLNVHTPANAGGEVRGQLVPDNIDLLIVPMTGAQEVPAVVSAGSATASVTFNKASDALAVHVNAAGLDDAVAAHVHSALAGANGPVTIGLEPDPNDVAHWLAPSDTVLDADQLAALRAGALYVNLHTPANPGGEVRGQIVPAGIEVVFTSLSPGDVVPPSGSSATGTAASTINTSAHTLNVNVNLLGLDDASAVSVNQAPVSQNGPLLFALSQDAVDVAHWNLAEQALEAGAYAALRSRGLYVTAISPGFAAGAVRGQIEPAISMPSPGTTFVVTAVNPADGATLQSPDEISVTFNRTPLSASVDAAQFELLGSGGDAGFADGNEIVVTVDSATRSGNTLVLDLADPLLAADTYQLSVTGDGPVSLTDEAGIVLDGDNDGNPGGIFISTFTIEQAPPPATTFTEIQTEIFNVSCAVSGCHSGGAPAEGMDLSAGVAYANIVGVASAQDATLNRIEPGEPDNSYMVRKVEGTAGSRMPLGQPALSNELIQKLRNWILDGAPDN